MRSRIVCRGAAAKSLARQMGVRDGITAVRLRGLKLISELEGPPFILEVPSVMKTADVKEIRNVGNSSLDGRIFRDVGGFVIELSSKLPPSRRAFTLAHELAHTFFLHSGHDSERADGTTGRFDERNEEEYLCDVAAAEMLMPASAGIPKMGPPALGEWSAPRNSFLKRVVESVPSVDTLLALAKEFETSITATARRYSELTPEDVYIGFWRTNPKGEFEFDFGFASGGVEVRIPRGFTMNLPANGRPRANDCLDAPSAIDLGLVNSAGERVGSVLTHLQGLRATGRLISISLLNQTAKRTHQRIAWPQMAGPDSQRKLAF